MFEATYLGHHGWLVQATVAGRSSRLLIDPLLGDGLGNMPWHALRPYPPREIDLDAFPPVDAVLFTHEHPDHLAVESLLRLEPEIPVLLSSRSSVAARGLLADLGRRVTLLRAGRAVAVGGLEVVALPVPATTRDEWDVMPVVVRDREGHGSLVTSVDAPETGQTAELVHRHLAEAPLGVWAYSHSQLDVFVNAFGGEQRDDERVREALIEEYASRHAQQFPEPDRTPAVLLLLWPGFEFTGEHEWLNAHAFPGNPRDVLEPLAGRLAGQPIAAPIPGHTEVFVRGERRTPPETAPFVRVPPRERWPAHAARPCEVSVPDYAPATGRRSLSSSEIEQLRDALQPFASFLYGTPLFEQLLVMNESELGDRRPTYALSLRREDGPPAVFEYDPQGCAFERVECEEPHARYAAGLECWAADMLAVLRIELVAGYVLLARVRTWSATRQLGASLEEALSLYTHPLRHPERYHALYRRTVEAMSPTVTPSIRLNRGS